MCYFFTISLPRECGWDRLIWIELVVIVRECIIHPAVTQLRAYLAAIAGILAVARSRQLGLIRRLTTSLHTRKDRALEHRKV